ncbi:diguanylate cyclase (GGDEF)-like protein [Litoreibacter ponti]|uniref:Diguanylate cyclase (GGDEF)-like protein n=1 Tax=Litoreibacter ponti TaxID=1510457 RepID=A0A2T6BE20_9RHOB|nr:GGDEF domain-containing protein [Litoreibacter ponti]PTX54303.1 diguanylate cyclase (GGDEF)-like protein [Litoreibacter ponti]
MTTHQETNSADTPAGLSPAALDALMPMHLRISSTGHIQSVGPTMAKVRSEDELVGLRLLEVFELRRPLHVHSFADLLKARTSEVRMRFRVGYPLTFKGVFVPISDTKSDGALLNLSLGANVVDAVEHFDLTSADFASSDPTVDMLYLIEAKSVALEESKRLNKRLEQARSAAEEQAYTDTLTGLQNRRGMDAVLQQLELSGMPFGLMHLDLDYFKQVNDTYGHAAGDFVLQRVAEVLNDETRSDDLVARVGGDEFVLVFKGCVDLAILEGIAMRMISRLERPIDFEGQECRISASIGTTLSSFYEAPAADQMLSDADRALYASKDQGRACHTVFSPDGQNAH